MFMMEILVVVCPMVFEWYGVELSKIDKYGVKEFLDVKNLQQCYLKVEKDGTLVQLEASPPPYVTQLTSLVGPDPHLMEFIKKVNVDQAIVFQKIDAVMEEVKLMRELVFGSRTPGSAYTARSDEKMSVGILGLQGLADAA